MSDINKIVYGAIQTIYQYPFDGDITGVDRNSKPDHFTIPEINITENPELSSGEEASTKLQKIIQAYIKK